MTRVVAIDVVADPAAWAALGLREESTGGLAASGSGALTLRVGTVALRIRGPHDGESPGVAGWELAVDETAGEASIDGLATRWVADAESDSGGGGASGESAGALGARSIDHLVVMTSSLERTCAAITEATGAALKRIREAGEVRQGFHRLGEVIVEVVESRRVTADEASFWGFVLVVDDIDAVCARLGDELIAAPKPAVQPGRRIATFRGAAGLGVPVALITPDPRAVG